MRLIVGISGASGTILGYYLLKALRRVPDMEIHLVMSEGSKATLIHESSEVGVADIEGSGGCGT